MYNKLHIGRNNFIHHGVFSLSKKRRVLCSGKDISDVVRQVPMLLTFFEEQLPPDLRRPRNLTEHQFTFTSDTIDIRPSANPESGT